MTRYRLDAEITVDGIIGRTIDVSAGSVCFEIPWPFAPGDRLALVLPLEQAGSKVNCTGQVVRVEPADARSFRVAATFEPVEFSSLA